jgi:hypothetical protein
LTPIEVPTGGWMLGVDPEQSEVIRRIVKEICAGSAVSSVAVGLDEDGIPAPKGGRWFPSSIWKITQSKYLIGHATYEGVTVRDGDGKAVLNAEPILSQEQWNKLQDALASRKAGPKRTKATSPMLNVVVCLVCGHTLHHRLFRRNYGKGVYRYYACPNKHGSQIDADTVEFLVEDAFLEAVGDANVKERVFRKAENHQIELDEAVRAVDELTPLLGTITSDTMRSRLTGQLRALDFRITTLENLPTREAGWDLLETGETYKTVWESSNTEQRRQLLLTSGITFSIHQPEKTQALEYRIEIPDDIKTLLTQKTPPNP